MLFRSHALARLFPPGACRFPRVPAGGNSTDAPQDGLQGSSIGGVAPGTADGLCSHAGRLCASLYILSFSLRDRIDIRIVPAFCSLDASEEQNIAKTF